MRSRGGAVQNAVTAPRKRESAERGDGLATVGPPTTHHPPGTTQHPPPTRRAVPAADHVSRHVLRAARAAARGPGEPEVTQLDLPGLRKEDVGWLDVTVDDLAGEFANTTALRTLARVGCRTYGTDCVLWFPGMGLQVRYSS